MQRLLFAPPPQLSVPMQSLAYGGPQPDLPDRLATGWHGKTPATVPYLASDSPVVTARTIHRILWIDDEVAPGDALLRLCSIEGFRVDLAGSGFDGLATARARTYDAVIVDLHLPDMFGLTVLQRLRASGVAAPVLAVTGHYLEPEIRSDALRAGATTFRYKPFVDVEEIVVVLRSMIAGAAVGAVEPATRSGVTWPYGIVAVSPAMRRTVEWISRVGPTNASALITGETGTGKELVARALHDVSARQRFVPLNCAAIPEGLVETELFGRASQRRLHWGEQR